MKVHSSETLQLVERAVAVGTELSTLLQQIKHVDTDALCRACGAECLQLADDGHNHCEKCGHVQADREIICLSDELWPMSNR